MTTDGGYEAAPDLAALRAEVADLRARMDSYERILQLRDAALDQPPGPAPGPAATLPLPDHFDIAADQLLPVQDGFYQLEWGPEGAFRWTGPAQDVGFDTWVDRSIPLVATLRLFHFGTPANAGELAIEVDGTAYPLAREGKDKLLRSEPIATRPGNGPTRITLRVPHLHSPAARGAADRRVLGVAFQRLRIEPA
ncbi:hypothetical protein [Roseomonas sp. CECT 9278]|uniref:hypothetical protein n=1 Tax=Roseomonas sp. CECT 9278 TaxID=2845823 RepID=UPI001E622112|nr:hypothetical protein [Roseomonas sp. CECT 9278]